MNKKEEIIFAVRSKGKKYFMSRNWLPEMDKVANELKPMIRDFLKGRNIICDEEVPTFVSVKISNARNSQKITIRLKK